MAFPVGVSIAWALGGGAALAYTAPYSTPEGITLVDTSSPALQAAPLLLWRRIGDANGNPLYTFDQDQAGRSTCSAECAKEFPPFAAQGRARAFGDWTVIARADHTKQWAYQGKPLYRYSGKDPVGEPKVGARGAAGSDSAQFDPASQLYSPKKGWRRAAFTPEKTLLMPPEVRLDGLAVGNGFGFVDAARHTVYAVPASRKLSADWRPLPAPSLAEPIGEFTVITRKDDGTLQWAYHGEALYTYAGDYAPGEVTGIYTGDKSVEVALAYRNFTPSGIEIGHYLGRGPLMTTSKGLTLYYVARFYALYGGRETRSGYAVTYNDAKSQGTQGCEGDCLNTWKPVVAPRNAQAAGYWEVVARPDGSKQWAFRGSPLYTYVGDKKAGDIAGNNRHVIVYGGADGQIVYADAGGDPRNPAPFVGKNINMEFASGAQTITGVFGGGNVAATATPASAAPVAPTATTAAAVPTAATAANAADADADGAAVDADGVAQGAGGQGRPRVVIPGTPGAGFYWHTVSLN